jgi:hypothetical protein
LHARSPVWRRRVAPSIAALLAAAATTACGGGAPGAFGPTPAAARVAADEFLGGIAVRFENVRRDPRWEVAREKISRGALNPSRLLRDDAVWTSRPTDRVRFLELEAGPAAGRYQFTPRQGAPAPDRSGKGRHVMRLTQADDGVYTWNTMVEHGVGRVRANDVAAVTTAALARLERPAPQIRQELAATLPRTSAALGRLFAIDSVRSVAVGDGSTRVDLRFTLHPERLQAAGMPAFAGYVRKYVSSSRLDAEVGDGRGARWLHTRAENNVLTVQLRLRDGRLLALDGPARTMPAAAELRTSAVTKFSIFEVGATNLVGDLATVRGAHERGWRVRWRRAPSWKIPLGVRHLINGSLNRPFAGDGMQMSVTMRDAEGAQTLLTRHFDVTVQESAIVRWFGNLGSKAMSDRAGRAEAEEDRFIAEALRAMVADIHAAIPTP